MSDFYVDADGDCVIDAATGEVLGDLEIKALADSLATEIVPLDKALEEAREEVAKLVARREVLIHKLRPLLGDEGRADGGPAWVVAAPPTRGSQRVSRGGCESYREQLLTLGLGEMKLVYQPPLITQVRAARADLVAAGIPLEDIAPTPKPGPSTIVVIPK